MSTNRARKSAVELINSVSYWYHRIEVAPGIETPGSHDSSAALRQLPLPRDLSGQRVLDLGTRDGFFAFEMERRGAEVVAIDYMPIEHTGFAVAKQLLGSQVEYLNCNVYDVSVTRFGEFDLVLCLGLLYHLRDPLLALDRIWRVCRGELIVETQVIDHALLLPDGGFTSIDAIDKRLAQIPIMQFYPHDSLHGDPSNWWAPNTACLADMLRAAGFHVDHLVNRGSRSVAKGVRTEDPNVLYQRAIEKASNLAEPPSV